MIYHVIGVMSGSSMDGLDLCYAEIVDISGQWSYTIHQTDCIPFDENLESKLLCAVDLKARDLFYLDRYFGKWIGKQIKQFVEKYELENKIHFVGSHGHTVFHEPYNGFSVQIGHGAAIAANCHLPVICDLRQMDVSYGGQGAPVIPITELKLFSEFKLFLNLGGICNLSIIEDGQRAAFDITSCNRVLNYFAQKQGKSFDENGILAKSGNIDFNVLKELNELEYFNMPSPKSLPNQFGTDIIIPILENANLEPENALATMSEHIVLQIFESLKIKNITNQKLLVTGGSAYNSHLVEKMRELLMTLQIELVVPDANTIESKEALAMAFMAVLRWREECNVLKDFTGANQNTVNGALWLV